MDRMIGCCGIVCTDCSAFLATQANDEDGLERVAAQWRVEYNVPGITVASVLCDGCRSQTERHCGHCYECDVRACATARDVANCAHCPDFGCAKIERFLGMVPAARVTLDGIRHSLS